MEKKARQAYLRLQTERGHPVKVQLDGLFVSRQRPYLAASTNGIIVTRDGDRGVLEIKCPVADVSVEALVSCRKNFCLEQSGAGLKLKRSHPYFSQLQMEMALTGCQWADFVVFVDRLEDADESLLVEPVKFEPKLWSEFVCTLEAFYVKFVVLELLTRRLKRHVKLLPGAACFFSVFPHVSAVENC